MISSLEGRRILITRQLDQAASMCAFIRRFGGIPINVPVICFKAAALTSHEQSEFHEQVRQANWIFFTSRNSIDFSIKHLFGLESIRGKKIAAVGIRTAHRLEELGLHADIVSRTFTGEMLVTAFLECKIHESRIVIPHGSLANISYLEKLRIGGTHVYDLTVYETLPDWREKDRLVEVVKANKIDALTFASPSAVRFFTEMLDERLWRNALSSNVIVSIGAITARELKKFGYPPDVVPDRYTSMDMVSALENYYNYKNH